MKKELSMKNKITLPYLNNAEYCINLNSPLPPFIFLDKTMKLTVGCKICVKSVIRTVVGSVGIGSNQPGTIINTINKIVKVVPYQLRYNAARGL